MSKNPLEDFDIGTYYAVIYVVDGWFYPGDGEPQPRFRQCFWTEDGKLERLEHGTFLEQWKQSTIPLTQEQAQGRLSTERRLEEIQRTLDGVARRLLYLEPVRASIQLDNRNE